MPGLPPGTHGDSWFVDRLHVQRLLFITRVVPASPTQSDSLLAAPSSLPRRWEVGTVLGCAACAISCGWFLRGKTGGECRALLEYYNVTPSWPQLP